MGVTRKIIVLTVARKLKGRVVECRINFGIAGLQFPRKCYALVSSTFVCCRHATPRSRHRRSPFHAHIPESDIFPRACKYNISFFFSFALILMDGRSDTVETNNITRYPSVPLTGRTVAEMYKRTFMDRTPQSLSRNGQRITSSGLASRDCRSDRAVPGRFFRFTSNPDGAHNGAR